MENRNVVPVASASLIDRYAEELTPRFTWDSFEGNWLTNPINRETKLIPAEVLPSLIVLLTGRLRPANHRQVVEVMAMIAAAWPYAHQKADASLMEMFAEQLAEELRPFPADLLVEVVKNLRRTCTFAPSIAEICKEADRLMEGRRTMLKRAQQHRDQHARRQAFQAREMKEESERRAASEQKVRFLTGRDPVRLRGLTVEIFDAAASERLKMGFTNYTHWLDGLDRWQDDSIEWLSKYCRPALAIPTDVVERADDAL
jgi:hypothetical protein